jgi:hypothetical protein
LLAAIAFVAMFHPNDTLVWGPAAIVLALLGYGLWRHRLIAPPKGAVAVDSGTEESRGDLSQLMAEAKREV